jgi:hypothetical protein
VKSKRRASKRDPSIEKAGGLSKFHKWEGGSLLARAAASLKVQQFSSPYLFPTEREKEEEPKPRA